LDDKEAMGITDAKHQEEIKIALSEIKKVSAIDGDYQASSRVKRTPG
jgi:hypothetical protein